METAKNGNGFNSKLVSVGINFLIFASSFVGILLACIFAKRDGYTHWGTRFLYFTQQSNIWIGVTSLALAIVKLKGGASQKTKKVLGILKYIFTVSITVTGIIFCTLLAPFADFNIWSFSSILTHIVVPALSIVDFFTDKQLIKLEKRNVHLSILPPAAYFVVASILCLLKVDFGRGDPFPYFFMDFYSEVGLFGFIAKWPPQIGAFYWFVFLSAFVYGLGFLYYKLHLLIFKKFE